MFACIHAPAVSSSGQALLVECARAFSPRLERVTAGTVVLDANGLTRLFGAPAELAGAIARRAAQMGLPASVAVAANPEAAVHAARGWKGVTVIPPGREAEFLSRLPAEVLAPSPETAETLARWGIQTCRDLAALPEAGLVERLGVEGAGLHKLARGAGRRPLVPEQPARAFEEALELEDPLTLLEPLAFLIARLLNGLCMRLASCGLAAQELHLRLALEDRSEHARLLRLPVPMRDGGALLKLLRLDLEAHPPQAPIVGVSLSARPGEPRFLQEGLFLPPAPEPAKLELTLARIAGLVGEGNVGWPEREDTHRPDAFRLSRTGIPACLISSQPLPLTLRRFRPPLRAEVEAPAGRPARLQAREVRGRVVGLAGPWRTSGDWWTYEAWDRDEWDVALSDEALYRVYLDRRGGGWYLEGSYD